MNDGYGPHSTESFAWYDHDTSSWKTSQGSLLQEWETYSETWPKAGLMRNGKAYLQPLLVPRTYGGESSSWPTPAANEPGFDPFSRNPVDKHGEPSLVRMRHRYDSQTGRLMQKGLSQVTRMWPTPKHHDGTGGARSPDSSRRSPDLRDVVVNKGGRDKNGKPLGQLNPTWVEWLMGFPTGWTDLEPSETP